MNSQEILARNVEGEKTWENNIDEQVGFRKVIDKLVETKKPIVGHNCFLDLAHLVHKFIEPLPTSLEEFKKTLVDNFGPICDTKYIANASGQFASLETLGLSSTSLQDLTECFKTLAVPLDFGKRKKNEGNEVFHDAGYDSLCTGHVFLGLVSRMRKDGLREAVNSFLDGTHDLSGRLYVMNSDFSYINLTGPELIPDRSCICHLSGFPAQSLTLQIQKSLEQAGFPLTGTTVYWINQNSAFVRFASGENAKIAKDVDEILIDGCGCMIMMYDDWRKSRLENSASIPEKRKSMDFV